MDRTVMTVIMAAALIFAGVMAFKMHKLKKDIYDFADGLERSLDEIIKGREPKAGDETADTLAGRVDERLRRMYHIWEQKDREKEESRRQIKELISDISHQTKTPIANQKLYLEILGQEDLPQETRGFLDKLEQQTDKLDFLFRSMIKMSRLETGIIQIQKKEEDLSHTLRRALSAVVPAASAKGIRLFADVQESLIVPHDPKWTEEAVFNLLDNAVKYTPEGGWAELLAEQGEIFTEIHVRDSGKGIREERQASVFTRFYREPEVHDEEGVGIGLYLTREIAQMQNGYVEVRSAPGEGSDFCICLPNTREERTD